MNINRTNGWVKLHKSVMNSWVWEDTTAFVVFTKLLLMAHHEDNNGSIRFNGKQIYLKKGQLAASRRELAENMNLPPSTLRGVLQRLQSDNIIDQSTDHQKNIISICNWSKYQSIDRPVDGQRQDSDRTANRQLTPVSKELRTKNKEIDTNVELLAQVRRLYQLFISEFNKNESQYRLTDSRKLRLKARIKDCGEEMVAKAIRGTAAISFYRGENDRGWKADLDFIIRSYEQVERLADTSAASQPLSVEEALKSL
jgi:hypothetical protein